MRYVVHYVLNPPESRELVRVELDSQERAEGYRAGLLAAGIQLVSEVDVTL